MVRCKPPVNPKAQGPGGQLTVRLKPLAHAIALLMVAGTAHGAPAFSSGWFADKGASQAATAARNNAQMPKIPTLNQQAKANQQLQRSLTTLNTSVAAIAAQQAAQAAGRQAALGQVSNIPDGLGKGGLQVDNSLSQGWTNAKGPTQTQAGGKTTVTIEQTADKAILNWETFNVGRNTTVDFQQQSNWAALNRVNDPNAKPSEIQGQIKGAGTVMIMNRNGVVFSGTSQVNVRNLVAGAANITDDQFTQRGIYIDANGSQPTFTDAAGKVDVQRGAVIQTHAAATSTDSGGYALLLGSEVENAGTIITAKGQTTLAAGDSFYIRRGVGTSGNQNSTTRGNEVATSLKAGSTAGTVTNNGLIMASTGDVTLTGHKVEQNGVALASTSVDTRGTIHLLNSVTDKTGSVSLGQGSTTAILLDATGNTALNSQRDSGLINLDGRPNAVNMPTGQFNHLSTISDRIDQSRVEIVSGGTVEFKDGSITLATGGQVAVTAAQRSLVRDGAMIDVSGAVGVKVSMESNNIKINVQGNEQRDAPVNRDGGKLINNDVWVDLRELVFVPAGTNGYATDRWYTAGGLLEVGGYLGTQGHTVGEWMAQGGTLTFTGNEVVTEKNAQFNLSGGTVDVQGGYIQQSWLKGPDGRLYELSRAPGDILYSGFYKGFEDTSQRWGRTDYYYNPLIASQRRYEAGYTVGSDAGKLVIGTTSAVLEGQLISDVFQGDRQIKTPIINIDAYQQSQKAAAQRAQLIIGSYTPVFNKNTGTLRFGLNPVTGEVVFESDVQKIANGLDLDAALPTERQGKIILDSDQLNGFELGAIKGSAKQQITVNSALKVADGGDITLYTPRAAINANLTAHGGSINAGNILNQPDINRSFSVGDALLNPTTGTQAWVKVGEGVKLDASGRWNNLAQDGTNNASAAWLNGGKVSLRSNGDVSLAEGGVVDVSSGATLGLDGKFIGGKGGHATLAAYGKLDLASEVRGYGVNGGGTLAVQARKVQIGDSATAPAADTLHLAGDFFNKGFSAYDITGNEGLLVTDGTQVDITMPVYHQGVQAATTPSGSDPTQALERWTPALYQENPLKGALTQRRGASLNLNAGSLISSGALAATTALTVGKGAVVTVDPGQAISVRSIGQLTIDGTLNAWGGNVTLMGIANTDSERVEAIGHGRSIWIGEQAVIDVASRAVTAVDTRGQVYGQVRNGGKITVGGDIDLATGIAKASDLFVVLREGARLDASGSQALLDVPGQGRTHVASNGGSIAFASNNGLYLDGSFVANAGGAGAAGGSLSLALESPYYLKMSVTDRVLNARELVLGQLHQRSPLADTAEAAADSLEYGHARLGVDQISAGGFDNLALLTDGLLSFDGDVSLNMGQSLRLYTGAMALSDNAPVDSRINLSAPYLLLAGILDPLQAKDQYRHPVLTTGMSLRDSQAIFKANANLIDVRGNVQFGNNSRVLPSAMVNAVDRRGFDDVHLISEGDLRFLEGADELSLGINTQLMTRGDMTLMATQLYPATAVGARVLAGYLNGVTEGGFNYDPTRVLTIGRTGNSDAPVPYSAFGRLQLGGPTIKQGGIVRAPLGLIEIGTLRSQRVELLPGSLTSASGKGLVLPYGGTVDGQVYKYNGKTVSFLGLGGIVNQNGDLQVGMILGGESVAVMPGATVDVSGGGELLGAGFISGRGGSTDARFNPLVQFGANGGFNLPGLATNPVYAIVPGVQPGQAPVAPEGGATDPLIGQQITLGAGVPGLAAGTYTLMPSTYALMPGAYRVEINGLAGAGVEGTTQQMRNGSWSTAGRLSIANTGISNSTASQLILTSAETLRRYSQYNETSYAQFAIADAAKLGVPRPQLEVDARTLKLALRPGAGTQAFSFEGVGRFDAAAGGYAGTVAAMNMGTGGIEIVAAGKAATPGFRGVTVYAESLNALAPARLVIGGLPQVTYGQLGNYVNFSGSNTGSISLREGATLAAPEVFLVTLDGGINVEQGAAINTIGRGKASYDSRDGFVYNVFNNMLAVSNGLINAISAAPVGDSLDIQLAVCASAPCSGTTALYSEGSIVALTSKALKMGDDIRYGTRHLNLGVSSINVGSTDALAAAAAANRLPTGITLNQQLIDRLLRGDTQFGAPALETLQLSARESFNFYGTTALDTYDAVTGKSLLDNLMISTPAIYGAGNAADVATLHTANLIWQGADNQPSAPIAGGAGSGSGRLDIKADTITFGYGSFAQPSKRKSQDRLALGFSDVNLNASQRITANYTGSLSVYQSQGAFDPLSGFAYTGGNLNILTPLMTGEAGSINRITAGGVIDISAAPGTYKDVKGIGAELSLKGDSIRVASAVILPSGKVTLDARGDVVLTDDALLDVSGRAIVFDDVTKYSAGGDVQLQSRTGNVLQGAGSTINLSATHNQAGKLRAVALDSGAGTVDLAGKILAGSSGVYDAGGTIVPYLAGLLEIQAQRLGGSGTLTEQFAALNQRLNQGEVFGARSFQIKQGDLVIGNDVKANNVSVSLDNGNLRVTGRVDASGERVGTINLAAKHGLTLDGTAVLDAHGSQLRVDSYGKIIDSPNRAIVVLSSGEGPLSLSNGVNIDLRHGTAGTPGNDGRNRGTLELNAPRLNNTDIAIDARGQLTIQGARSIALNGMARYDDAPTHTDDTANGRPYQVIDQAYLDQKHALSVQFINAALSNKDLMNNRLSGLNNATYADAFHVRPGVEIVSKTPDGDLVVQGDLDLSGYRYASVNPHTQKNNAVYGSGEVGSLTLRAGGDLNIYGSINDGFAPPPPTDDDNGWVLLPGIDYTNGTRVIPGNGVTLADGTLFPAGSTLNFDLPIKGARLVPDSRLPVAATLTQPLDLTAGTVLAAAVRDASGNVLIAAGTRLSQNLTLPEGTVLDAGNVFSSYLSVGAMIWPKGVPLPAATNPNGTSAVALNGNKVMPRGALLPAGTDVKLAYGATSVQLRVEEAGSQGKNWGIAPMLTEGSQAWSIRLVAGADTQAADSRQLQPVPATGHLRLADTHYGSFGKGALVWTLDGSMDWFGDDSMVGQPIDFVNDAYPGMCDDAPYYCASGGGAYDLEIGGSTRFSVVRTGAADLELLAGGNLSMESLFGVYTAGSSSYASTANDPYNLERGKGSDGKVLGNAGGNEQWVDGGPDSLYRAWYPDGGGNLLLKVGGNLTGDIMGAAPIGFGRLTRSDVGHDTANVGDWLWRQGNDKTGSQAQSTAWWINFGSYVVNMSDNGGADQMTGFTGFGTLGGGNLDVDVRGNAGISKPLGYSNQSLNGRSQGLVLAVGSTGRVGADGSLQLTGGGDLNLRVGGAVNGASDVYRDHLNGALVNLRGHVQMTSGALGSLTLRYGIKSGNQSPSEVRALDALRSTSAVAAGGMSLLPGDATFSLATRGDLVLQDVSDPGRAPQMNALAYERGGVAGIGQSWFSLWTERTAVDLFSSGGNLTPLTEATETDMAAVYPATLRAVAANGSLYYGHSSAFNTDDKMLRALVLAPSTKGQLELLAGDSIYGGGLSISRSSAAPDALASIWNPAYVGYMSKMVVNGSGNLGSDGNIARFGLHPLFAFGPNTASMAWGGALEPARFYALNGDLLGVSSGRMLTISTSTDSRYRQTYYEGAGPVRMLAGRDIVSSGTPLGGVYGGVSSTGEYTLFGNLFIHNNPNDISIVSAGRDILFSNYSVAGPGTLELTAGRNILMQDKVSVTSLGGVAPGDTRPGANIVMQAGFGPNGADFQHFVEAYLNPANRVQPGEALTTSGGKVAKTYERELVVWLAEHFGFIGDSLQARAFYAALPVEQQRVFAREVYFAELKASGREYNEQGGVRQGSYVRGRAAIAVLFPEKDVAGNPITYKGDITLFGGAGVHTDFGGSIQLLTPGGGQTFGIEGAAPPASAGIITQGAGDIQLYSQESILLGQSRIMTTFGGAIMGWSAAGDINAGRGSKTTVVYTPPKRVYDGWGNVGLAPSVPSTGAGIATLNPIPEVPAGDIDLIAPLGTIDAGEAGIRVSGNINIAALRVVNAANIQTQGKSSGVPVAATVNTGAISSASSAGAAAAQAADSAARSQQAAARQARASIVTVEVLSFGSEPVQSDVQQTLKTTGYNPNSPVQVLGAGPLSEHAQASLTDEERRQISL